MIPFGYSTITLFHKGAGGYTAHVIDHCYFRHSKRRDVAGKTASAADESICRIPAGAVAPDPGDVIALGAHKGSAKNEVELVRLLESLRPSGAFRVQSVSDNARPGMPIPHYAAKGE